MTTTASPGTEAATTETAAPRTDAELYKARILGDWEINGNLPEFVWRAGETKGT